MSGFEWVCRLGSYKDTKVHWGINVDLKTFRSLIWMIERHHSIYPVVCWEAESRRIGEVSFFKEGCLFFPFKISVTIKLIVDN